MAAVSSNDVWAVGSVISGSVAQTFIEHWNGKNWAIVPSPNDGTGNNLLTGVTAISASDVWAVGDFQISTSAGTVFQTLTEHWDGTQWAVVRSPNRSNSENHLLGVSARAAGDVWAVGFFAKGSAHKTLIEHWNGGSWSVK